MAGAPPASLTRIRRRPRCRASPQMLAWMKNPVPASRVELMLKCDKPTDISPTVGPACDTYVGNCQFGSFDVTKCRCVCMGEGAPGGYCVDEATGSCTKTC